MLPDLLYKLDKVLDLQVQSRMRASQYNVEETSWWRTEFHWMLERLSCKLQTICNWTWSVGLTASFLQSTFLCQRVCEVIGSSSSIQFLFWHKSNFSEWNCWEGIPNFTMLSCLMLLHSFSIGLVWYNYLLKFPQFEDKSCLKGMYFTQNCRIEGNCWDMIPEQRKVSFLATLSNAQTLWAWP